MIAVEPAEKIGKRPTAIANQINAVGERLAAFGQMRIEVGYTIRIIDDIPGLEGIEFTEAILGNEYGKSVIFGYEPARRMQGLGVEVYVIAPQNWDEQGKRQVNDKHDALVMCRRLSEYLGGHAKALSIVRIPSPEEEARGAQGRMREQLCRQIRRMQAMGRSLLLQRGMAVRGRWWRGRTWEDIRAMPSWVIAQLESWKELLELAEKQVRQIEVQLKKQPRANCSLGRVSSPTNC